MADSNQTISVQKIQVMKIIKTNKKNNM